MQTIQDHTWSNHPHYVNSKDLRENVKDYLERGSLKALSVEIGISRTTLSLWYHEKYISDASNIEEKLNGYFYKADIGFKDERILSQIEELLQGAKNRQAIVTIISLRN